MNYYQKNVFIEHIEIQLTFFDFPLELPDVVCAPQEVGGHLNTETGVGGEPNKIPFLLFGDLSHSIPSEIHSIKFHSLKLKNFEIEHIILKLFFSESGV